MGTKDAELWAKLVADAEDRADAELSEDVVDAELRAMGADPEELARAGAKIAAAAQAGRAAPPAPVRPSNGAAGRSHGMSSPIHGSGMPVDVPKLPVKPKKK